MDLLPIIIGIGAILLLVTIYIAAVILNRKTKVPKGCELAYLEATCGACLNKSCEIRKEESLIV